MDPILAKDIFLINNLNNYKLHLASKDSNGLNPLDEYVFSRENWIGWNASRRSKNIWTRRYIFSLIEFYPKSDSWLFGGIFEVLERRQDSYIINEVSEYRKYEGRLIFSFHRNFRSQATFLETYFDKLQVSEILPTIYNGEAFPGYQNINHDFSSLEMIIKNGKVDWMTALLNVKGIYLITDKFNGKKYIGSASGASGVWSRWSAYIENGHGGNDQLSALINEKSMSYCRTNFKFTLIEVMPINTPDEYILGRELFWKKVVLSREFGYNSN